VKVLGISTHNLAILSADNKLVAVITCCVPVTGSIFVGCNAETPDRLARTEIATKPTISQKKRKTGSGNLLPLRSTQPKNPPMPCWASFVDVFMVCSPVAESNESARPELSDLHPQFTCVTPQCHLNATRVMTFYNRCLDGVERMLFAIKPAP